MFQKYISETEIKNWEIRNIDRLLRKSYNLFTGKKQIKNKTNHRIVLAKKFVSEIKCEEGLYEDHRPENRGGSRCVTGLRLSLD